jgi:hypothetical protein
MIIHPPTRTRPARGCAAAALLAVLTAGVLWASVAQAKSPLREAAAPEPGMVVAMAQLLVQQQVIQGPMGLRPMRFDLARLHPQNDANFWAVVGGFVSDFTVPNTYIAAVRLICPDFNEIACWRLDALAINDEVILKMGRDL